MTGILHTARISTLEFIVSGIIQWRWWMLSLVIKCERWHEQVCLLNYTGYSSNKVQVIYPLKVKHFGGEDQSLGSSENKKSESHKQSQKLNGVRVRGIITFTTPLLMIQWKLQCQSWKQKAEETHYKALNQTLWLVYSFTSASDSNNLVFTRVVRHRVMSRSVDLIAPCFW